MKLTLQPGASLLGFSLTNSTKVRRWHGDWSRRMEPSYIKKEVVRGKVAEMQDRGWVRQEE